MIMTSNKVNEISVQSQSWLLSLGYLRPPADERRNACVVEETKKPRKKREADRSKMLVRSRQGKKLRRGIFALLRQGIDDQVQVYDLLFYRGFIKPQIPGKRGIGISKQEFLRYLAQAMVHLKVPKKTKSYLIIEKYAAGKKVGEIAKELSTSRAFVRLRLIEAGLIEKLPQKVAKINPHAWSKSGIKSAPKN